MKKSLSVHKNTIEKKRRKEMVKRITRYGAKMCKDADIRAFALVGIAANGRFYADWDTGSIMPMWAFPATISLGLTRDMEEVGIDETWKPPVLPIKG